jgi:hypothetical protein
MKGPRVEGLPKWLGEVRAVLDSKRICSETSLQEVSWSATSIPPDQEALVPDRVKKVSYCYPIVPNRAGQGARVLGELNDAGVDLLAYSGFPVGGGRSQLDLVLEDMGALRRLARRNGWRLSKVKKGFLIQGNDRVGAVHRHLQKLADAGINVTAADGVSAGQGRYGMILWVKPRDYARAARALGAR